MNKNIIDGIEYLPHHFSFGTTTVFHSNDSELYSFTTHYHLNETL